MIVETIVKSSQPAWREFGQWPSPEQPASGMAPFSQSNGDEDPDPPPAAPAARLWPRVFPGL
jgi:hypothetical protein